MAEPLGARSNVPAEAVTTGWTVTITEIRNNEEGIICLTAYDLRGTTTHSEKDDELDLLLIYVEESNGSRGGQASGRRFATGWDALSSRKDISRCFVICIFDDASVATGKD